MAIMHRMHLMHCMHVCTTPSHAHMHGGIYIRGGSISQQGKEVSKINNTKNLVILLVMCGDVSCFSKLKSRVQTQNWNFVSFIYLSILNTSLISVSLSHSQPQQCATSAMINPTSKTSVVPFDRPVGAEISSSMLHIHQRIEAWCLSAFVTRTSRCLARV